ncbi:MAG: BON domain-containing protein [Gammaproteobacteria bacterium]
MFSIPRTERQNIMTNSIYRNTLIVVGIAATLGLGAAGCDRTADQSSKQAGATQDITDTAITASVKAKLALARDLDSSEITVATANGAVTLTGSVNDTAARSAAETATRSIAGVTSVNNRLSVSSPGVAAAAKNTGEAVKATGDAAAQAVSDTWITTKIKSVLLADSEAKGLKVNVDTKDGVVSLEGELATQAAVDHVTALAQDVEGVKRVNSTALKVARN